MVAIHRSDRALSLAFLVAAALCLVRPAAAHPMGNFSISHYSRLAAQPKQITLRYVLDFAEIPTVSERDDMGVQGNAPVSEQASQAYLRGKAAVLRDGLTLTVDGKPATLTESPVALQFRPGAGGLDTMRVSLYLTATLPADGKAHQIAYQDGNYAERTGWKEIVATGSTGMALSNSSVPTNDVSKELTVYPANPTLAPPQQTEATFTAAPGADGATASVVSAQGPAQPQATNTHTPQDAFTQAIARKDLTPDVMLAGLLIAFVFGSFHALSPGHGKTMVAAYLVGSRGTVNHAVALGVIVTITHTLGVFTLGLVTLFASKYVVPEKLYPILSVVSGLAVFGVGIWLLTSRLRGVSNARNVSDDHGHSHDPADGSDKVHPHLSDEKYVLAHAQEHPHSQDHNHGHSHGTGHHHHHIPEGPITAKSLLALGISGGIVPCPSALVVLLSAVALHRIGYGMVLITAFSVGLASVLIVIGMMVVSTRHWFERFPAGEGLLRRLPIASAAAITLIGIMLVIRAVTQGV